MRPKTSRVRLLSPPSEWRRYYFRSMCVCARVHVCLRSGPVSQTSLKRLKLRTSNLMYVSTSRDGPSGHDSLTFWKRGRLFRPLTKSNPWTDWNKIWHSWLRPGNLPPEPNLVTIGCVGPSGGICEICDLCYFIFPEPTWRSHRPTNFHAKWLKRRRFRYRCAFCSKNQNNSLTVRLRKPQKFRKFRSGIRKFSLDFAFNPSLGNCFCDVCRQGKGWNYPRRISSSRAQRQNSNGHTLCFRGQTV